MIRSWLAALAVAVLLAMPALADDFEAGVEAYEQGDPAAAAQAWKRAAEDGNLDAMYNVGILYETGEGVEQDYATAARWYQRALDAGMTDAAFNLGNFYIEGRGVERNVQHAIELYERAAQDGHPGALHHLGVVMLQGIGVDQDPSAAAELFFMAAQQGSIPSVLALGSLYEEGHGVERDLLRAASLYHTAASAGSQEAAAQLRAMRPTFEQEFRPDAEGQALVRQIQALLNAAGIDAGPVDGMFGPQTERAIQEFQELTEQPQTGQATREVRDQLVELLFNPMQP